MNGLLERPIIEQKEIVITLHMVDGNFFVQRLPVDEADGAEDLLKWYRNPRKFTDKTWTWHCPSAQTIHIFHHSHIIAIDIEGFIEPEGRESKWYEKIADKWQSSFLSRKMKGR